MGTLYADLSLGLSIIMDIKFNVTIKTITGDPMEISTASGKTIHTESFDKFGNLVLFSQNWFKASGANRSTQIRRAHGKTGSRRIIFPKEYVSDEIHIYLNQHRSGDFREYTLGRFLKSYLYQMDMMAFYDRKSGPYFVAHPELGVNIVDIYDMKHSTGYKNYKWKSQWVLVEGDMDDIRQLADPPNLDWI